MDSQDKSMLTRLQKIDSFKEAMKNITLDIEMPLDQQSYILSCAIVFIRHFEKTSKHAYLEFAYYIFLKFAIYHKNYKPLYYFASNYGLYPLALAIAQTQDTIWDKLVELACESFEHGGIIELREQQAIREELLNNQSRQLLYVAPTSYGKSTVILEHIQATTFSRIAIIVPSKSLLNQTFRMIKNANLGKRIVVHDEMYDNEKEFIAILTQERALRLLGNHADLNFDILYIDEAHNLLHSDSRNILLTRLIKTSNARNKIQTTFFLSPLIANPASIRISPLDTVSDYRISFNIKEPEYYEYRHDNTVYKYNRFSDQFYALSNEENYMEYLKNKLTGKSFIFLKRPKKIEEFANEFAKALPPIVISNEMQLLIDVLKKYVGKEYYIIRLLEKGIIYLHGKMPDSIKNYLEYKYKSIKEIKYLIANTVILEGVNLPISSLAILNTYGLTQNQLINLIGRVNRLNQIFVNKQCVYEKLMPHVYFINSPYCSENNKMQNVIQKKLRSSIFTDKVSNPLLSSYDPEKSRPTKNQKKTNDNTMREEEILFSNDNTELASFKKLLISEGISVFFKLSDDFCMELFKLSKQLTLDKSWYEKNIFLKIKVFFLDGFECLSFEIKRLINIQAITYYMMLLENRTKSLKENVQAQFKYYKKIQNDPASCKAYFGKSYGEIPLSTDAYNKGADVYIDLRSKTDIQLMNLCVVKLKMELDFLAFEISKLVNFLYKVKLISKKEYNMVIHGTDNEDILLFLKLGVPLHVIARLESDRQLENINIDDNKNIVLTRDFETYKQSVDDFHKFELDYYL